MTDHGEGRLDWVTCPKVYPVLGWEVIEGQEGIGILGQAVNSLWVLGSVLGLERGDSPLGMIPGRRLPNLMDTLLNLWTQRFGHVVGSCWPSCGTSSVGAWSRGRSLKVLPRNQEHHLQWRARVRSFLYSLDRRGPLARIGWTLSFHFPR